MQPTLISWNINYSARTVDEYAVFDWKARKELVLVSLEKHVSKTTIFCLQEVSNDSKDDICQFFEKHGFYCVIQQTHPAGRFVVTASQWSKMTQDKALTQLPDMRMSYLATRIADVLVIKHAPSNGQQISFANVKARGQVCQKRKRFSYRLR